MNILCIISFVGITVLESRQNAAAIKLSGPYKSRIGLKREAIAWISGRVFDKQEIKVCFCSYVVTMVGSESVRDGIVRFWYR